MQGLLQYTWSVFTDEAFAPTSAYAIVRLMLHRLLMDVDLDISTVDMKDAFLIVRQPEDEKTL